MIQVRTWTHLPCSRTVLPGVLMAALCFQVGSGVAEPAPARPFLHSVVLVDILPDRTAEALPILRRHAAETRRQPGCVAFDLVEERPPMANHFAMLATWRSDHDREAYVGTDGAVAFRTTLQPLTASPLDERIYVDVAP